MRPLYGTVQTLYRLSGSGASKGHSDTVGAAQIHRRAVSVTSCGRVEESKDPTVGDPGPVVREQKAHPETGLTGDGCAVPSVRVSPMFGANKFRQCVLAPSWYILVMCAHG